MQAVLSRNPVLFQLSLYSCVLGVFILFMGMTVLPTSKIYRGLLYLFLFLLPLYAACKTPGFFTTLVRQNKLFFGFLLYAFIHTLIFRDPTMDSSDIKVFLYIPLLLLSLTLLHKTSSELFIRAFLAAAVLGGIMSIVNIVYFYGIREAASYSRLIPLGMMETPILSSYIFGTLAVGSFAYLMRATIPLKWQVVLIITVLCNFAYVYFSGSRSPLAAACCGFALSLITSNSSHKRLFIVATSVIVAALFVWRWESLLERGFSYRPELISLGIQKGLEQFWFGFGVLTDYELTLSTGASFRTPHNQFVEIFVNLGFIGLCIWVALLISALWAGRRYARSSLTYMMGSAMWVFAVVSGLAEGDSPFERVQQTWFICWIPLCWLLASNTQEQTTTHNKPATTQ